MGWDSPDVYYQPEHFGLTVVGSVQWGEPDYDFHITAVWFDADKHFFVASDSGCSCPSPFEDFETVESLGKAMSKWEAASELLRRLQNYLDDSYESEDEKSEAISDVSDLVAKIVRVS